MRRLAIGDHAAASWLVVTLALSSSWCARAEAQALVLPVTRHPTEGSRLDRLAERIAEAARSRGQAVVASAEAMRQFERAGSAEPASDAIQDATALAECTDTVVNHVTLGRYDQALAALEGCQERTAQAIDSINRESEAAQSLFDLCLYGVRAYQRMGDPQRAHAEVLRCRRDSPDMSVDENEHPSDVVNLVRAADRELARTAGGSLEVRSDPEGCALYLNGRRFGTTPQRFEHLAPGLYRVQAECGDRPGRVHRVELGRAQPETVLIDVAYDDAVRSSGALALSYDEERIGAEDFDRRRLRHGLAIGSTVGASEVWLVTSRESASTVQVDRVTREGRVLATVRISASLDGSQVHGGEARVLDALLGGHSLDLTGGEATAISTWSPPAAEGAAEVTSAPDQPSFWNWIIGGAGLVGAVAVSIAPFATLAEDGRCAVMVGSGCRTIVRFGEMSAALLGLSAALLTASVVWLGVAPIRVSVSASPSTAALLISGDF